MHYFWTLFWTFLLMHMVTYVAASMSGSSYDFVTGNILTVVMVVFLYLIPAVIPNESNNHGNEAH